MNRNLKFDGLMKEIKFNDLINNFSERGRVQGTCQGVTPTTSGREGATAQGDLSLFLLDRMNIIKRKVLQKEGTVFYSACSCSLFLFLSLLISLFLFLLLFCIIINTLLIII